MENEYLIEERQVLLECLERNYENFFPYDLINFWRRVEDINKILRDDAK